MSQKKGDGGFTVKDRRPGFAIIDNALIDDYGPTIGAYGIAAYCILVRFAKADGTDAYPSYQTVADLMNTSRRTAIRAIKKLTQLGLIEKESRKSKGESLSNIYVLVDIKRMQVSQVVGSVPQALPGVPQALPGVPQALGSASQSPDQDTNNKTPITRVRAFESERARAATPTPPPATPPAGNGNGSKPPRLPNDSFDMPDSSNAPSPGSGAPSPKVRRRRQTDGRKFAGGYIPADQGATPVEVYYESFSIDDDETRLTKPDEDDLRKCDDLSRLREIVVTYRQCNFKRKRNIRLILDWYRDGIPEQYRRKEATSDHSNRSGGAQRPDRQTQPPAPAAVFIPFDPERDPY